MKPGERKILFNLISEFIRDNPEKSILDSIADLMLWAQKPRPTKSQIMKHIRSMAQNVEIVPYSQPGIEKTSNDFGYTIPAPPKDYQ